MIKDDEKDNREFCEEKLKLKIFGTKFDVSLNDGIMKFGCFVDK